MKMLDVDKETAQTETEVDGVAGPKKAIQEITEEIPIDVTILHVTFFKFNTKRKNIAK